MTGHEGIGFVYKTGTHENTRMSLTVVSPDQEQWPLCPRESSFQIDTVLAIHG